MSTHCKRSPCPIAHRFASMNSAEVPQPPAPFPATRETTDLRFWRSL